MDKCSVYSDTVTEKKTFLSPSPFRGSYSNSWFSTGRQQRTTWLVYHPSLWWGR